MVNGWISGHDLCIGDAAGKNEGIMIEKIGRWVRIEEVRGDDRENSKQGVGWGRRCTEKDQKQMKSQYRAFNVIGEDKIVKSSNCSWHYKK